MGEWIAPSAFRCSDLSALTDSLRACLSPFDVDVEKVPPAEHNEDHDALIHRAGNDWIVVTSPLWFYSNALIGESVSGALETLSSTIHVYDGDYWTHLLF